MFYRTRQGINRTCGKHAMNAFLGRPKVNLDQMRTAVTDILAPQRELIDNGLVEVPRQGKYHGFETSTIQLVLRRHGVDTDSMRIDMPQKVRLAPPTEKQRLNETQKTFLEGFVSRNNLKNPDDVFKDPALHSLAEKEFAESGFEARLKEFASNLADTDRCMVNCGSEKGSHWVAFRKDRGGNWHLLDSQNWIDDQPIVDPCTYLRGKRNEGSTVAEVVYGHRQGKPEELAGWIKSAQISIKTGDWPTVSDITTRTLSESLGRMLEAGQAGKPLPEDDVQQVTSYFNGFKEVFPQQDPVNLLGDIVRACQE